MLLQADPARQARELVEKLRSDKMEEREAATRKLKELGDDAGATLESAAQDRDPEVASRVRSLLRPIHLRRTLPAAILRQMGDVVDRLASEDPHAWTEVFQDALIVLRYNDAIEDRDGKRPQPSFNAEDLDSLAVGALRGALTAMEKEKICGAIKDFGLPSAVDCLVAMLNDHDPSVRRAAVSALGKVGRREDLPAIQERLEDEDRNIAFAAVTTLSELGAKEVVLELLHDRDDVLISVALRSLGAARTKEAIPESVRLLKHPKDYVRRSAVEALGDLGVKEAIPDISKLLDDPSGHVRANVLSALGNLGAKSERVPVTARLTNSQSWVRVHAVWSLVQMDARESVPELIRALKDENGWVRAECVKALRILSGKDALDSILPMLQDPHIGVRSYAAYGACLLGSGSGIPVLLDALKKGERIEFTNGCDSSSGTSYRDPLPLIALNAVRKPDQWSRLQGKKLRIESKGMTALTLEEASKDLGLAFETTEKAMAVGKWERRKVGVFEPSHECPFLDVLEIASSGNNCQVILEADTIRVLSRDEALKFWGDWWKAEQGKK
jgi:HEAT repeat protein